MKTALVAAAKKLASSIFNALISPRGNNDNEGKRKAAGCLVGLIITVFIVPAIAISLPGILLKGAVNKAVEVVQNIWTTVYTFFGGELEEYDVYVDIRDTYIDYIEELNGAINFAIKTLEMANTYEEEVTIYVPKDPEDPNSPLEEVVVTQKVVPEIIKDIRLEKPRYSHLMSYIAVKYINNQGLDENDKYKLDHDEAIDYFNDIMLLDYSNEGENPIYFTVTSKLLSIEDIADKYFTDPMQRGQFITSFYSLQGDEDELVKDLYEHIDLSTVNIHKTGIPVPHLLQTDSRWAETPYRTGTIKDRGAAPVCLSMVLSYFAGDVIRPDELTNKITTNYSNEWRIFEDISNENGIVCKNIGKQQTKIIEALEKGEPLIAFMKNGEFSSYVVIRGVTDGNKLLINDPNDVFSEKDLYLRECDINKIFTNSNTFFVFSKN